MTTKSILYGSIFLATLFVCTCKKSDNSQDDSSTADAATSTDADQYAGVLTGDASLGAVMLNDEGQTLVPRASFDSEGKISDFSGAIYNDLSGGNVTVTLDPSTHLPSTLVLGKYIYLFSGWDLAKNTVNMTEVYPDNQWISSKQNLDIGSSLSLSKPALALSSEDKLGAGSCVFDNSCPSTEKKLAELFRVGSLAVSVTACIAYAGGTAGLGLFACSNALLAEAKFLIGNENWLHKVEKLSTVLLAANAYRCGAGIDVGACLEVLIDLENHILQQDDETLSKNENLLTSAWAFPLGTSQGTQPAQCPNSAAALCSPGSFLPCIDGGSKQCQSDCSWGSCPSDTSSSSSSSTSGSSGSSSSGGSTTSGSSSGNSPFQGSYTASYSGTCVGRRIAGSVTVVVAKNGSISVDEGGGSGSVNDSGGATFGGGDGYTFNGTFSTSNGKVTASGSWSSSIASCTSTRWSI
jgi:hypothetical protein